MPNATIESNGASTTGTITRNTAASNMNIGIGKNTCSIVHGIIIFACILHLYPYTKLNS